MSESQHAMEGMKEMADEQVSDEIYNDILFVAQPDDEVPSDFEDNHHSPAIQKEFENNCPETAFITQGSSSLRQRQNQSTDTGIIFSFATNPRPPTFVALPVFETHLNFNHIRQIWSRQISSRGPPTLFS